jgi:quercetin dioxygenase-like cupin family protein
MTTSDVHELVVSRADGRDDGEDWTEDFQQLPGGAGVSVILESTSQANVGPRLHKHPYAETFVIRRGSATFTIGSSQLIGRAGQVLVAPAQTPHKFSTGPAGLRSRAHPRQPPLRHRLARVASRRPVSA